MGNTVLLLDSCTFVDVGVAPPISVFSEVSFIPGNAGQFMNTYTEYLPQKIYMSKKLRDIHTSNCSQIHVCEEVYEVIYKTDSGHTQHLYFGYIYYHLDTYITIWIYIYIVIWTYILQFGHKYGNSTYIYIYHFSTF